MKNCPNCGKEISEGVSFCPNCGVTLKSENQNASANAQVPNQNTMNNSNYSQDRPRVKQESIATCIILSFVTCGIYGIIWFINIVNNVNTICNDEHSNQSGATVFLLSLITCGIYSLIWFYQAGGRMKATSDKYAMGISDNSLLYLLLNIFGFGLVSYCLLQSDINKYSM